MRLSKEKSQTTGKKFPIDLLCRLTKVPRSSFYEYRRQMRQARQERKRARKRPGPKMQVDDDQLLVLVRKVLAESPFATEVGWQGFENLQRFLRLSKQRGNT